MKKFSPDIKLRIINLSKCFWFWDNFYTLYSTILNISKRDFELRFPRDVYNKYKITEIILDDLEKRGEFFKIKEIISYFYSLEKPFDKDKNSNFNIACEELKEFKKIIGKDIKEEYIKEEKFKENLLSMKKKDDIQLERTKILEDIKNSFYSFLKVQNQKEKQDRGYWLEKTFFKILELERVDCSSSYKAENEQIDGKFKFKSFDYLVEVKWTEETIKQKEVSIFDGKLKSKGQSTRGFILSISGFDESAINFASGNEPRLIFMDATEFMSILEQRYSFLDIFSDKEDKLVRLGKVYK